jgi:hypothetical protein
MAVPAKMTCRLRVSISRKRGPCHRLNGLYLNLAGREKQGIIAAGADAPGSAAQIGELIAFRDPGG